MSGLIRQSENKGGHGALCKAINSTIVLAEYASGSPHLGGKQRLNVVFFCVQERAGECRYSLGSAPGPYSLSLLC